VLSRLHRRLDVGRLHDGVLDLLAALEVIILLLIVAVTMTVRVRAVRPMHVLLLYRHGLSLSL
jgi:hypothetical protein